MTDTKKGVKYTFEGQYYTGSDTKGEQVKTYSLDVVFPSVEEKALSYFKTGLIRKDAIYKLMIAKYSDFVRVRTMVITNVEDLSGKGTSTSNIATMNRKQLASYIAKNNLGIDVEVYADDITRLRNAIIQAEENPETFKETYAADVEAYNFSKGVNELNNVGGSDSANDENKDNDTNSDNKEGSKNESSNDDLVDELLNGSDSANDDEA